MLRRAVISNLLLVGLSAVVLTFWYAEVQSAAMDQQLHLRAEALTEFLATQSQFGMLVTDRPGLEQIAHNALSVEDVLYVDLRDAAGQSIVSLLRPGIWAKSISEIPVTENSVDGARDARFISTGTQFLDVSRAILAPNSGGLMEWENGKPATARLGTVRVGFSTERQERLLERTVGYGIAAVLTCLLAILGVQYYQLREMLKPLRGLIEFAGQVGKGDLKRRAPVVRPDEIGRLTVAFNQMVDELGSITVSKNYVKNILQSMGESMVVVDGDGRIRTVNQAATSLLGYTQEQLIGQRADLILHTAADLTLPANGVERVYRLSDGREIPVLFSAAALPDDDDADSQVWLAQDISARKRVEEELRAAKRQAEDASQTKSNLLSRTSHELRTPLNAILGFGQLLEMGDLSEIDRENVGQIVKAGRHLLRLVNEVLEIAGVESGRKTFSPEAVHVGAAVSETLDLVRPLAASRNITIREQMATGLYVTADRQRLEQILLNLLSNAVKYNHEGGSVFVDCEQGPKGFLRIRVRDTGPGIPPEGRAKLFVPFERLGAEQGGVEGTGLGLSFAKAFIEAMGGSIGVSSVVGEGSTFWIDVPLADAPSDAIEFLPQDWSSAPASEPAEVCRLLYVEDNPSNRELVERIVSRRPAIQLMMTADGEHGLAAAHDYHPNLILLDLHLPDIWGDEVLRRLKADPRTAGIPVIMLSADATPTQIQRLLGMGADAYLTKPINVRELLTILDERMRKVPVSC
jgi:PAS domain S-box-containing protein